MEELRNKLLDWAKQFETPDFIKDDPIFFPHKYSDKKDIEISAFLTSWIAFGNRKLIMQQAEILDNLMGNSPYAFIMNKVWEQYKENTNTFYRMFTYHDFFCICQRLYNIYQEWDDLEVFYEGYNNVIREIQTDFGGVKGIPKLERDSPCKRICLFLRWGSTKITGRFRYLEYYSPDRIIHTIGCTCCKNGTPAWDNNTQNRGLENGSTSNQLHENNFPG